MFRIFPTSMNRQAMLRCCSGALASALMFVGAGSAAAQDPDAGSHSEPICSSGKIAQVVIANYSVFTPDALSSSRRFSGAYRLLNKLHIRTNEGFIRREILFREGDCFDAFRLEESGRLLRAHNFIANAEVYPVRRPDGDWTVQVVTQDEWTTEFNVVTNFEEGFEFRGIELTEKSVLGTGVSLSTFYLERDHVRDVGFDVQTPNLFSRLDARLGYGRTRSGHFFNQGFFYPFVGEVGRVAARQIFNRREGLFSYSMTGLGSTAHALLPTTEERADLTLGWRLGKPGSYTVLGFGVSRESFDFVQFPNSLQLARDNNFADAEDAGDQLGTVVSEQVFGRATTRVNVLFGIRALEFERRRGLDSMKGMLDVPVGTDISIQLGQSLNTTMRGGNGITPNSDLFTRLSAFQSFAPTNTVVALAGSLEGRRLSVRTTGDRWHDVLGEADAYAYWKPNPESNHTLFARVSYSGGWSMTTPFQLTLGGPEGVRGFSQDDLPGGRRLIVTAEERVDLNWPTPETFDLGMTLFADGGKVWAGDVPFGVDSDFQASVGAGLRIGFPQGTRQVIRIDAVTPATGSTAFRDVVLRVSFGELIGLSRGFSDVQMSRSRRSGVSSNLFSVPWAR